MTQHGLPRRCAPHNDDIFISDITPPNAVTPAHAGVQGRLLGGCRYWIPAFAGMTAEFLVKERAKALTPPPARLDPSGTRTPDETAQHKWI